MKRKEGDRVNKRYNLRKIRYKRTVVTSLMTGIRRPAAPYHDIVCKPIPLIRDGILTDSSKFLLLPSPRSLLRSPSIYLRPE